MYVYIYIYIYTHGGCSPPPLATAARIAASQRVPLRPRKRSVQNL